ncbi:tRNA pseudouridine(13) synthase TruD [Caviibacterium pharyngocola]|uniref:tRNA pseudouridine synthase D n=1 Tax=Caviibacterium pharyngocola TaxID=28159 RepID=A0A2M8RYA6_9PAST|nr:tRNA pseudouridine(13) synthase TruD [Caviibacterium pharyngocola]PJG83866.1 tRNA pseudouridine(13) synthase TruD [Caviibacterium pharyngocola]
MELAFLYQAPQQSARLKAECRDFIVKENLGYEISGEGEFVAVKVRKTDYNTLFVAEKLAQFVGISAKNVGYAGLKDKKAITEQWFSLQMPGKPTPDFSRFQIEGIEILAVTRHNRKIRIGSLAGNAFEIRLRDVQEPEELNARLENIRENGFPNYFTEQRFGKEGNNLIQALRWAKGEITVKDRKKRSFYLSAARSEIFNLTVSDRITQQLIHRVLPQDILQLQGSHSWFKADENEDLNTLQVRLKNRDILLTAPLIGDNLQSANERENAIIRAYEELHRLMQKERMKAMRRPMLCYAENLTWHFDGHDLLLQFYLPAGSYATALVRELVHIQD